MNGTVARQPLRDHPTAPQRAPLAHPLGPHQERTVMVREHRSASYPHQIGA